MVETSVLNATYAADALRAALPITVCHCQPGCIGAGVVLSGVDAGAHCSELVNSIEECGKRRQNLIRAVHEGVIVDAHRVDSQRGAPAFGVALLLLISVANVGGCFTGGGSFAQPPQHGGLALEDFLHIAFHENDPIMERLRFSVLFTEPGWQGGEERGHDFNRGASGVS